MVIANDQSIAYGCAKAFRTVGADLAITWLAEALPPRRKLKGDRCRSSLS